MWLDNESDGCIYDTADCDHTCEGCEFGKNKCDKCGFWFQYPNKECDCEEMVKREELLPCQAKDAEPDYGQHSKSKFVRRRARGWIA